MRVRLELARAFFLKREDDLSHEHFERVLAGGPPPPPMIANIRRFLEEMRARRRWSGWFGATLAPDSNVNAASDSDVIHIGGAAPPAGLPYRSSSFPPVAIHPVFIVVFCVSSESFPIRR